MFHNTILLQSGDAVAQWYVSRLLHGRSWVRNQVGVDECKFILFSFGKIGSSRENNSDFLFQFSNEILYHHNQLKEFLKTSPIQN